MTPELESLLERGAVLLEPCGPAQLTENGKRVCDKIGGLIHRHASVLTDIAKLAEWEQGKWERIFAALRAEGVPTAVITSGVSQYLMPKLLDTSDGKTQFTTPTTVALALGTAAPSSTTTGATFAETTYTGYGRVTIAAAGFNAGTAATPSVVTNVNTLTFGYTSGSATLLGFILADSATASAGNSLWYGTLASVSISSTQNPPTVAAGALSLSMTGT